MVNAEIRWLTYLTTGLMGFSDMSIKIFVEDKANNICKNLGLTQMYEQNKTNPIEKLLTDNLKGGVVESRSNFFEGNVVEYSKGSLIMDI